jgi:hypothetical protein
MDTERSLSSSEFGQRGAVLESMRYVVGAVLDRAGLKFPDDDADVLAASHPRPEEDS